MQHPSSIEERVSVLEVRVARLETSNSRNPGADAKGPRPGDDPGGQAGGEVISSPGDLVLHKDWYTTKEAGQILKRSRFQVCKWCREGRVRCKKKPTRGRNGEWVLPREEVERLHRTNLELLPIPKERRYRYRAS